MRSPWPVLVLLFLSLGGGVVRGDDTTGLTVELGWNGAYRIGRWTPLFITISHDRPLAANIELTAPHSGRQSMRIVQPVTLGPSPTTFCLYFVAGYDLELLNIDVRDAERGRLLASDRPFEWSGNDNRERTLPTVTSGRLVGVSGRGGWSGPMRAAPRPAFDVGTLPLERLPDTPIGYDAIDLLILNAPDLSRLSKPQQRAIGSWVRSGGKLLFWADENAVPDDSPLLDVLPAVVGPNVLLELPADQVASLGLPERFTRLRGRSLQPKPDATPVDTMSVPQATGFVASAGRGRVAVLPFDASLLLFNDESKAGEFWSKVLSPLGLEPSEKDDLSLGRFGLDDRLAGVMSALEHVGAIEGGGSFDFGTIAWTLLGLMFVVGPLDWFVLKRLNRQPWTWATTTGWIGLVTVGSLYAGQLLRSGELYLRSVSIIEQVDGRCVAARDIVAIYSPTTRRYELTVPTGWWQPLPGEQWYASRGLREEYDFVQSREGNAPVPLRVPIWSLRFLYGQRWIDEPAMIDSELRREGNKLVGTLQNPTEHPVNVDGITCGDRHTPLNETIAPGGSLHVDAWLFTDLPSVVEGGRVLISASIVSDRANADLPDHDSRQRHVTLLRAHVPLVEGSAP